MDTRTHDLVSVSVTWRICSDLSEKSTGVELVLISVCRCGATTEYTWKLGATSAEEMEALAYGLIVLAQRENGPVAPRLHSPAYSSDLPTN